MSRLSVLLVLVAGLLVGGIGAVLLRPAITEAQVRSIAEQVVAAVPAPPAGLTPDEARAIAAEVVAELPAPPNGLTPNEARAIAAEVVAELPSPAPGLDRSAVETIVSEFVAAQPPQNLPVQEAELDPGRLNPMIESYLLQNPSILQRVSEALQAEVTAKRKAESAGALAELQTAIYEDPAHIVLGNPNGDVTLVEMFDYNCGYCKQAMPDLAALIDDDPNLKVILKEFPILSPDSAEVARVAVLVAESDVDYWAFHEALFTAPGKVNKATALKAAADLGLNPLTLELRMNTPEVAGVIDRSYKIADRLQISGTPTYIIGDEIIPGAIGIEQLRSRIANMRACGSTECRATPG